MPIKNLTDASPFGAGLPKLGTLFKGDEKPESGDRPGKDLPYFRMEFEEQFEAELRPVWEAMYGKQPTEFAPVLLAASTADEAFDSWKEEWNTSHTLLHRCDGEHQVQWYNESISMTSRAKVACVAPACKCKNVGRIKLILPAFVEATGLFGYISVRTTSLYDILTMYRYLADIERMYGSLSRIPFVFGRAGKEVNVPRTVGRGKQAKVDGRMKVKKSLFYLHVTAEFTQQRLLPVINDISPVSSIAGGIDTEKARKLLGRGDGNRRIGEPLTSARLTSSNVPPPPEPIFANEQKWDKFVGWTVKKYAMHSPNVLVAFDNAVDYPIDKREDWREDETKSVAAVLCFAFDYDLKAVEAATVAGGFDVAVWVAAQDIIQRQDEDAEPEEEPVI